VRIRFALWVFAAFGLAIASSGCLAHFEPSAPMRARSADVDLSLVEFRTNLLGREFVLHAESAEPHVIRQAHVTVPSRAPCEGGATVQQIRIDGQPTYTGLLPAGSHTLSAGLARNFNDFTFDMVVDFELEDGGCLRAPIVSQSIPMVTRQRWSVVMTDILDANATISGLTGVFSAQLGLGRWVGPFFVAAHGGIGQSFCSFDVCGKTEGGTRRSGLAFPGSAEVRYVIGDLSSQFGIAPSVGVRYTYASVELPTLQGDRRFSVHGVQADLAVSYIGLPKGPFAQTERMPVYDFTIPLGIVVDPKATAGRVAFAGGMGMRFYLPL